MKRKNCAWCGDDIGPGDPGDREPEPCAKPECVREVRAMREEERRDAHEQLDRDMGWL